MKKIEISSDLESFWAILTNSAYAKIIGNELDKKAFLDSNWELNAIVYFKYESDKIVAAIIVTEFKLHEIVYLTGILQLLFAIGLLLPRCQNLTTNALIVLFVLLTPANIYAGINHINIETATNDGDGMMYMF